MRPLRLILAIVVSLTLIPAHILSAQTDKATITPEAEAALNSGLAAAREKDWDLAIKYFKEAKKASPFAPEVLFNLALAYDKADGCDLFAAAYYRAYLVAAPEAEEKDKIQARINDLVRHAETTAVNLIRRTEDAYNTISKIYGNPRPGSESNNLFYVMVIAWLDKLAAAHIYMGDWDKNTWEKIIGPWDKQVRSHATMAAEWHKAKNKFLAEIARALCETRDAQGLKKWVDSYVHDDELKKQYASYIEHANREYPGRISSGGWMIVNGIAWSPDEEYKRGLLEDELKHWLDFIFWFDTRCMEEDESGREICVDNPQYWESILNDMSQKKCATGQIVAMHLARASHGMAFTIYHLRAMDEYYRTRHAEKE
jgi:hypothetical protein